MPPDAVLPEPLQGAFFVDSRYCPRTGKEWKEAVLRGPAVRGIAVSVGADPSDRTLWEKRHRAIFTLVTSTIEPRCQRHAG